MTKLEVQQRVLQYGKPLDLDEFMWDEKTFTFSSAEDGLVLDFRGISNCTFDIGYGCTFKTGPYCTFDTGSYCTFDTGSDCTFSTGSYCIFDTGYNCVVVRRDIFEVIMLEESKPIKLNGWKVLGYSYVKPIKTLKIGDAVYNKAEVEEALKNVRRINC